MRNLGHVFGVVIAITGSAFAQDTRNENLCKRSSTAYEERVAACTALIESTEFDNNAWAYEQRGDAHQDADQYDLSVADFSEALALEPDMIDALEGRALTLYWADREAESLEDTSRLIELQPEDVWSWNLHGLNLQYVDRNADSLAAFDRAIELNPEHYFANNNRGRLLHHLERFDEAIPSLMKAAEIRPLATSPLSHLASAHRQLENNLDAARYYRTVQMINPNIGGPSTWLSEMVQPLGDITLPPYEYEPPEEGLSIRYIQSFLPVDQREEMEIAIMALAAWFSAPEQAGPEALSWFTRTIDEVDGDSIKVAGELGASENIEDVLPNGEYPPFALTFRGMMPVEFGTIREDDPVFAVWHERPTLEKIWPLEAGKSIEGTGTVQLICPEEWMLIAALAGCGPGVEAVHRGDIEYGVLVEKAEQIHVPLGVFDTYVIRYRLLGSMEALGRRIERTVEIKWWFAPELGFWIKRTNERGGKIAVIEAFEIVSGG